jgi:hypothetical protein
MHANQKMPNKPTTTQPTQKKPLTTKIQPNPERK